MMIIFLPIALLQAFDSHRFTVHPFDKEEDGGGDLEDDGEAEESDDEAKVRSFQVQGMAELIGIGCEKGDVHQSLKEILRVKRLNYFKVGTYGHTKSNFCIFFQNV